MPSIAIQSRGTTLHIGRDRFDQARTIVIDHVTGRIRGLALSSGSESQVGLRKLRKGNIVWLRFETPERLEFEGIGTIQMYRVRAHYANAITVSFVFQSLASITPFRRAWAAVLSLATKAKEKLIRFIPEWHGEGTCST